MKKTRNIFNYMLNEPENIDEKTIYENTGVNADNVKELVMNKIHESKSANKKNRKKKITFTLIAAAAAVAVLGTTAAATGSFNSVFGEMLAGEMKGGMYAGGNVQVQSDDLDIDFKGIAGDKHEVYGMMTITKKDGSAFVENTDDYFFGYEAFNEKVDCKLSPMNQLIGKLWYFGQELQGGDITYTFKDANTVNAVIYYGSQYNIIGETLTVNESKPLFYHTDEVLCTDEEINAFFSNINENTDMSQAPYLIAQRDRESTLKDGQVFMFDGNGNFVIASEYPFELKYDLSVKLNYKDTTKYLDEAKGKTVSYNTCNEMTVTELEAHAFGLKIEMVYPTDDMDKVRAIESKFDDNIINHVEMTMQDGTVYTANQGGSYQSHNIERIDFAFSSDDWKKVVIDPDKITKVVYNGTTIYNVQ